MDSHNLNDVPGESPYIREEHVMFRDQLRRFIDEEIKPKAEAWEDDGFTPRAVLRRIAFIVFAQKIGLSLDEVAIELSKLPHNHVPERGDWAKLSAGWSQRIDNEIAQLQRLRERLTRCIGCGCLTLKECQFANPGDRAGKRGPGPRYWLP